jgi:hypothetical protein
LARLLRLVLLAVVIDAMMPWIGGLTVRHATRVAWEVETDTGTASAAEGCPSCSAETEIAASRAEARVALVVTSHGFAGAPIPVVEGHLPPLFRPPIAA